MRLSQRDMSVYYNLFSNIVYTFINAFLRMNPNVLKKCIQNFISLAAVDPDKHVLLFACYFISFSCNRLSPLCVVQLSQPE